MPTVNDAVFYQASTILNSIVQQASGQAVITPTNTNEFVTTAQTALKIGTDAIMSAISNVLTRTIFSIRPYTRKFRGMEYDESAWGFHIRKLSIADKAVKNDDGFAYPAGYDSSKADNPLGNGLSVDMQTINKPSILQTNFYGASVIQDSYTIFRDQMETAFQSPERLMEFVSMVTQNMSDKLEKYREEYARATLANWVGSILDEKQAARVVHLLSEYNTATGLALTAQSVYQPENFAPFMRWVYARVAAISAMMTERSEMYQTVVNEMHVMRHTPERDQRVYLFAPAKYNTEAMVLADTYHDNYLTQADTERVNYWQSIETPDSISVKPSYIGTDGAIKTPESNVEQAGIYGVIMDKEACGYSVVRADSAPAPYNARGRYQNTWFNMEMKNFNDLTEKGVVLILD